MTNPTDDTATEVTTPAATTGTATDTVAAATAPDATGPAGSAAGYRPGRTLPLRVELERQLRRRRTQLTLGLLVLLPLVLLAAFELGTDSRDNRQGGFVDLATTSGPNFTIFALFASSSFLLVVVVALFFGDTVASEASWSSLRYLLATPVPRPRLLRQKTLVSAFLAVVALVLLPLVSLTVGSLVYGATDAISPVGDSMPFATAVPRIGLAVVYLAIHLSWVATLALLLSVSTDAPLGAVGGAVLLSIVSQILDSITALGGLRDWLPTHYAFAWANLLSSDVNWDDMAWGAFSAIAYASVFGVLAWRKFSTKDVTS